MRKSNGTFSYYFSGSSSSILGDYFQVRSAAYGRYLKEQQQNNAIHPKTTKKHDGK